MPSIVLFRNASFASGGKRFVKGKPETVSEEVATKLIASGRFVTEEKYKEMLNVDKNPKTARKKNPAKLVLDPDTGAIIKKDKKAEAKKTAPASKNGKVELPNFVSKKNLIKYGKEQYGIEIELQDEKGEDKKMKDLIAELTGKIKESFVKADAASDPEKEGATAV